MLVHLTSITTITNKPAVNPLQICHIFERKVTKHSLFRPLHFVNFQSPKCRKCQFRALKNANVYGEESPRITLNECRHSYFFRNHVQIMFIRCYLNRILICNRSLQIQGSHPIEHVERNVKILFYFLLFVKCKKYSSMSSTSHPPPMYLNMCY